MAKKKNTDSSKDARQVISFEGSDIHTLYVNSANIEVSSFDVRMKLGLIHGRTESGDVSVKETAVVYMSHQHFVALFGVMASSLRKLKNIPDMEPNEDVERTLASR